MGEDVIIVPNSDAFGTRSPRPPNDSGKQTRRSKDSLCCLELFKPSRRMIEKNSWSRSKPNKKHTRRLRICTTRSFVCFMRSPAQKLRRPTCAKVTSVGTPSTRRFTWSELGRHRRDQLVIESFALWSFALTDTIEVTVTYHQYWSFVLPPPTMHATCRKQRSWLRPIHAARSLTPRLVNRHSRFDSCRASLHSIQPCGDVSNGTCRKTVLLPVITSNLLNQVCPLKKLPIASTNSARCA